MSSLLKNIQPSVKKETKRVAIGTFAGVIVMWVAFFIVHLISPEQVPFDYRVILAGFCGGLVAVLNFLLMGLNLQKVVSMTDESAAQARLRASYSQRMMLQMLWAVLAIAVPCFQFVAGLLPLLFPNLVIKAMGAAGIAGK